MRNAIRLSLPAITLIFGVLWFAGIRVSPAAAYCTGTFEVPPVGWTSYQCTDSVTGGTIIAVAGHRPSDGKPFVDVSCANDNCHGHASVEGIDANWNGVCSISTTGDEATAWCNAEIAYYVFTIEGDPS